MAKKEFIISWMFIWVFVVIFGEVITGIVSKNPAFFKNAIPIIIYYGAITFIFLRLFNRIKFWVTLVIIFIYGGIAEVFFFKGINIFVAAGLFYIFLFATPYLICAKKLKKK